MSDVVITGFGAVTPLGDDAPTTWQNLLAGTSGVATIEDDWAAELPVRFAAQVKLDPAERMERVVARRLDRVSQLALLAAEEAWADSGLADFDGFDGERLGIAIGTGIGGLQSLTNQWDNYLEKGVRRVSPHAIPMLMANAPAAQVGLKYGARAGVHAPVSACASSSEAISLAFDQIRLGRADVLIVGGSEAAIHALPISGFAQMKAMSTRNDEPQRASRPWDQDRDGFVMGEGAVMMVFEKAESAMERGAKIYGTIAGSAITADGFDMVQPDPSGQGQYRAMVNALQFSGIESGLIKHVNAHATSTPAGDLTEARAIAAALGEAADDVWVTGTKSQTGHLLGGAGALETFATVMALKDRMVPPTINLDNPEPELPVKIATTATALPEGRLAAINNSFGFGGHNVSIVVTNDNVN